ncbi:MAG: hypothetical protein ACREQP_22370, partial [Candidatus Binatia bacterium]
CSPVFRIFETGFDDGGLKARHIHLRFPAKKTLRSRRQAGAAEFMITSNILQPAFTRRKC